MQLTGYQKFGVIICMLFTLSILITWYFRHSSIGIDGYIIGVLGILMVWGMGIYTFTRG